MYFPNAFSPYIYKKKFLSPPYQTTQTTNISPPQCVQPLCRESQLCSAVTQFEQVTAEIRARR